MKKYRDYMFEIKEGDCEGEEFAVEIISVGDDSTDKAEAMNIADNYFPNNWIFHGEVDPYLVEMYGIDTY